MKNIDEKTMNIIKAAALCVLALLSVFVGVKFCTASGFSDGIISYLDEKKTTVLELTAAATTSSAAITMIPGDIGTPIADKLADLSGYTLIVLCAIFLEKYLLTVTGKLAFGLIIPVWAVITAAVLLLRRGDQVRRAALKAALLSLVLYIAIPVSVGISKTIENTYENSIQETIESAENSAKQIQNNTGTQSLWDRFISTIEGGVNTVTQTFEGILNNFIEAVAVLIVTACLIPVLVLVFMFWIIKLVFRLDIPMPRSLKMPAGISGMIDRT